ncbi:MAG TPA: DUF397 domain-containing protein [Actinophytocola sp.]|uniref:DUF397 domain-containing protein n=1 Tax=Actinophytocola sp. TaxID=1872138 RepID=UPI002E03C1FC|nr:DUF397 domain-containing protein [Actinophytocola sp.]
MTVPHRWHKSNYSGSEGACVELGHTLDIMRDSKNPDGPALRGDIRRLLAAIKGSRVRG